MRFVLRLGTYHPRRSGKSSFVVELSSNEPTDTLSSCIFKSECQTGATCGISERNRTFFFLSLGSWKAARKGRKVQITRPKEKALKSTKKSWRKKRGSVSKTEQRQNSDAVTVSPSQRSILPSLPLIFSVFVCFTRSLSITACSSSVGLHLACFLPQCLRHLHVIHQQKFVACRARRWVI